MLRLGSEGVDAALINHAQQEPGNVIVCGILVEQRPNLLGEIGVGEALNRLIFHH